MERTCAEACGPGCCCCQKVVAMLLLLIIRDGVAAPACAGRGAMVDDCIYVISVVT